MDPVRISREVPLDQLRHPDFDVRQGRPEADIRSIAQSMGDPGQGQQQPINVFPADRDDLPADPGDEDLHGYFQGDGRLIIHDGVTRALAAQKLGWETIWAVITPRAPENEVIARLSANTDRVDMTDYETVSTLFEYYDREDITQADLAEKAGMGASTLSKLFSVLDGPDWLRLTGQPKPPKPRSSGDCLTPLTDKTVWSAAKTPTERLQSPSVAHTMAS